MSIVIIKAMNIIYTYESNEPRQGQYIYKQNTKKSLMFQTEYVQNIEILKYRVMGIYTVFWAV